MSNKLSTTLRDLQKQLAIHAASGLPVTAADAAKLSGALAVCSNYAAMLEGKLGLRGPAPASADATVLRFPPRIRAVVTQSVTPPEGDSA
ncbi:MAG: hypothetical protein ABL901_12645 [Hyphomicrobiaceae bacterium]